MAAVEILLASGLSLIGMMKGVLFYQVDWIWIDLMNGIRIAESVRTTFQNNFNNNLWSCSVDLLQSEPSSSWRFIRFMFLLWDNSFEMKTTEILNLPRYVLLRIVMARPRKCSRLWTNEYPAYGFLFTATQNEATTPSVKSISILDI